MLRAARRDPSALLLATQLAGLVLYPYMEGNFAGRALLSLLGVVILWIVVAAVDRSPAVTWVGVMLGVPATVLLLIQAATDSDALNPYSSALEAILYFYAAGSLIAYMLGDHRITRDELFAVGATFTLVAWGFAYAYTVCQAIYPGSFTAATHASAPRTWLELLFLSVTTLTSVGLSDVTPIRSLARSLVMVEELGGVAYVAMLVSRIVGLTVRADPR
jgi:ion channel